MAFGPRRKPGNPSLVGVPKWPPCPGCCLTQHSKLALGHGPELLNPAPSRCGQAKGHPEQCGRRWLHAHENKKSRTFHVLVTWLLPSRERIRISHSGVVLSCRARRPCGVGRSTRHSTTLSPEITEVFLKSPNFS